MPDQNQNQGQDQSNPRTPTLKVAIANHFWQLPKVITDQQYKDVLLFISNYLFGSHEAKIVAEPLINYYRLLAEREETETESPL